MKRARIEKDKLSGARLEMSGYEGSAPGNPSREEISQRAYELYLNRGCADGSADEDWQQAERELQARVPTYRL